MMGTASGTSTVIFAISSTAGFAYQEAEHLSRYGAFRREPWERHAVQDFIDAVAERTPRALATSRGRIQCAPELRIDGQRVAGRQPPGEEHRVVFFVDKQSGERERKPAPARRHERVWERPCAS